jgi:Fe-S cluster biogenesis protein NfuA
MPAAVASSAHGAGGRAPQEPDVRAIADRIEGLLAGLGSLASTEAAAKQAEELVRTLVTMYGTGLRRVLSIVYDTLGEGSDEVFARLCDDPFVESLLCLHDLHPVSVDDRVRAALDAVRPYLKSHEGGVDIASIEGDVVILRLEGNCKGCPSSTATVKLAVERAILERVPEIREVRAEEAPPQAAPVYDGCVISLDDLVLSG